MQSVNHYLNEYIIPDISSIILTYLQPSNPTSFEIGLYDIPYLLDSIDNRIELSEVMKGAFKFGSINTIYHMLVNCKASVFDWGLKKACISGHISVLKIMYEFGANDYEDALIHACHIERMDMAKFIASHFPVHFHKLLLGACKIGDIKVAKFMIECGADNFDDGIVAASHIRDKQMIDLMIENGATDLWACLYIVNRHGDTYLAGHIQKIILSRSK